MAKKSFFVEPRHSHELKWYAIDLDGTLAESVWPDPGIGEPIMDNVEKLIEVHEAGYKCLIYTARSYEAYEMIESWLKEHNLHRVVTRIVCGKPLVHRIVDDKAIPADAESWL